MRFSGLRAMALGLALLLAGPAAAGPTLLFDVASGVVLYAEDADDQWHPASVTKIMTAYVTFQAIKAGKIRLDTKIPMSEAAAAMPPSKLGLPIGGEITVETALQVLIVKSANDVAVMLAEAVGGSTDTFVAEMNATAKRLGMSRTNYVNPNGLPAAEQITTARDLARLARAVARDFPEYAPLWQMSEVRFGKIRLTSHNHLLKTFEGADGFKTGFICDSGYNIVASATRDGHRLGAVVLGEQTGGERNLRAASLLEHGFQNYGWKQVFNPVTIDNMPLAADAKPIAKMHELVISYECGSRQRIVRANRVRARTAAAKAAIAAGAKKETAAKKDAATAAKKDAAAPKKAAQATAQAAAASPKAAGKPPAQPAKPQATQ